MEVCFTRANVDSLPKAKSLWSSDYLLETDVASVLALTIESYYKSLIGILRLIIELGRGDFVMEVSAMASVIVLLLEGHLSAGFRCSCF